MFNLTVLSEVVKEHQRNQLEEAKKIKMLKAIRATSPSLRERLFVRAGDLLIAAGLKLRGQYEPAMRPTPKAYQSGC